MGCSSSVRRPLSSFDSLSLIRISCPSASLLVSLQNNKTWSAATLSVSPQPPFIGAVSYPSTQHNRKSLEVGKLSSFASVSAPRFPCFNSYTEKGSPSQNCSRGGQEQEVIEQKMRDIQLSLNQTQKIRLQKALQKLESLHSKGNSDASVTVADTIPISLEDNILKGHGTAERNGEVVATVCGVVERVNMLVYVRSLRSRYKPEIGDIIVGRVVEVAQKRWKLEINFNQDAVLMLSSMNLPDGIQRRRTAVDELNMRNVFEENDVICAEVRNFQNDGSLQLQARSQKYGKLEKGQLLKVPPYLVKRQKQHFHHLVQHGVDLILGCNGFIWVGEHCDARDSVAEEQLNNPEEQSTRASENMPLETRRNICGVANAVRVLSTLGFSLTLEVILEAFNLSRSLNLGVDEMLGSEFHVLVAEKEAERRSSLTKKKR